MKVMVTMFLVYCAVVGVVDALKCHQGADNTAAAASTECPVVSPVSKKCNGPVFVQYTGLSAGAYGCGECAGGTVAAGTCEQCEDAGCNAPVTDTKDFKCPVWAWDPTDEAFKKATVETTCKALKATKEVCNSNGAKADKTYVVKKLGCGPCVAADKKAEKCADNSAATITAFLLPMIALFYTLF